VAPQSLDGVEPGAVPVRQEVRRIAGVDVPTAGPPAARGAAHPGPAGGPGPQGVVL